MTAFNRRSVWLFVRRNQIIIDLVPIHTMKKKVKAFSFYFFRRFLPHSLDYIGKDLLEIIFLFSLRPDCSEVSM